MDSKRFILENVTPNQFELWFITLISECGYLCRLEESDLVKRYHVKNKNQENIFVLDVQQIANDRICLQAQLLSLEYRWNRKIKQSETIPGIYYFFWEKLAIDYNRYIHNFTLDFFTTFILSSFPQAGKELAPLREEKEDILNILSPGSVDYTIVKMWNDGYPISEIKKKVDNRTERTIYRNQGQV